MGALLMSNKFRKRVNMNNNKSLEIIALQFESMNKAEEKALKGFTEFNANTFEFCFSVFSSVESKAVSQADIARKIGQSKKSVSIFYATGSVFAEFDGFAEFSELVSMTPAQVKELAQDRKLGVTGLKELAELSADVVELAKNLEKEYKKPAKKTEKAEEKKTQNRAKKENSPAVTIEKALETLLTFIEHADDIEKLNAVRNALIVAINKRAEKEKAKAA